MTFRFTAKTLVVNGEEMNKMHNRHAVGEHIKAILFGVK